MDGFSRTYKIKRAVSKNFHCGARVTKRQVCKQHKENLLYESQTKTAEAAFVWLSSNFSYPCCATGEEILSQAELKIF